MKKNIIRKIRMAHRAHMSWISKAAGLIEGMNITEESCPLHATECVFGTWYYSEGQILKKFPEFKQIEKPHMNLHQAYMQIFKIISDTKEEVVDNRSFFKKLVGKKPAQKDNEQAIEQARKIFRVLQKQSDIVIACLHKLEDKVESLDETFFRKITRQRAISR
ncbi:MAG TPA: hypothetical protein ENJ60_15290 [Aeromonadales bacterium]|nr:hypothetical protein [Aeromonadales bacterium]